MIETKKLTIHPPARVMPTPPTRTLGSSLTNKTPASNTTRHSVAAQLPEEPPEEEAGTEEEEPVADELATVDSQEEANGEE